MMIMDDDHGSADSSPTKSGFGEFDDQSPTFARTSTDLSMGAMQSDKLTLSGFDARSVSEFVSIVAAPTGGRRRSSTAGQNLYIEYIGEPDVDMHGVVFGNAAIPRFSGNAYFEVTLDRVREDEESPDGEWGDGLTLGVTTSRPDPSKKLETACDIEDGYSIGYFGGIKVPSADDIEPIEWSPVSLQVGDRVGLMISRGGEASIVVNGTIRERFFDWPTEQDLFAFVDLLGNSKAISLNLAAHPPRVAL